MNRICAFFGPKLCVFRRILCRICAFFYVSCAVSFAPALAEDIFIDGLPDVPLLDVVSAIEGDPVIFDTPSGTVAEFSLTLNVAGHEAVARYDAALTALGWACLRKAQSMSCEREENRLVFTSPTEGHKAHRIILRLEPAT